MLRLVLRLIQIPGLVAGPWVSHSLPLVSAEASSRGLCFLFLFCFSVFWTFSVVRNILAPWPGRDGTHDPCIGRWILHPWTTHPAWALESDLPQILDLPLCDHMLPGRELNFSVLVYKIGIMYCWCGHFKLSEIIFSECTVQEPGCTEMDWSPSSDLTGVWECEGPCYLGGVGRGPVRFGRGGEQRTSATWGVGGEERRLSPSKK